MNTETTTETTADLTAITAAITALVSEYETLDGMMTIPARGRRATALERVTAATFSTVTEDLDPYDIDDLNDRLAEATLRYSLFVTDLMATAVLDFREKAALHHHLPESYRDLLRGTLLDIWLIALEELKRDPDAADADDAAGDGGECDAGEWGDLVA